jgi:hypothetical protein
MSTSVAWDYERQSWLEPFLKPPRNPARRRMCPLYVAGLIGPGERKSLQPMAARLAPADYDQLHTSWQYRLVRMSLARALIHGPSSERALRLLVRVSSPPNPPAISCARASWPRGLDGLSSDFQAQHVFHHVRAHSYLSPFFVEAGV